MQDKVQTIETPGVLDKYQAAGKIANDVLLAVLKECVVGKNIVEICRYGDRMIQTQLGKIFNKKKIDKGIAFPTCVSPNNICGHLSPLPQTKVLINQGDLVKVFLGVQIDGFSALAGHTIVVNSDPQKVNDGKKADVTLACYKALQASLRLLRPGNKNSQVTNLMNKVAKLFEVNTLEGCLSHQIKKYLIDSNNCIGSRDQFQQKVDQFQFQLNQVFCLDFIFSTGAGKSKDADIRCTVFKRAMENNYYLKTKQGRAFLSQVNMRFPALPFTTRAFQDEITAKLGIKQCIEHDLITPFPVLVEKVGQIVAQFSYTVVILKGQTMVLSGLPLEERLFKSDKKLDEETDKLLQISIQKKKKQ